MVCRIIITLCTINSLFSFVVVVVVFCHHIIVKSCPDDDDDGDNDNDMVNDFGNESWLNENC